MFFKNTDDFKAYSSVNKSFDFNALTVYLKHIDRTILVKHLGVNFLIHLQTLFDNAINAAAVASPEKEVIELVRLCSAPLAVAEWIPSGQVQIDNSGIRIASSENFKTAFQWQIKDLEAALRQNGISALDDLLKHLHANLGSFPLYSASDEYKANKYFFVPSATEFTGHFSAMNNSLVNFSRLGSIMRKVEDFEVKSVILPDYFDDLKVKLQATSPIGADDHKIIDMIKPAVVNLTIARAIEELSVTIDKHGFMQFDNTSGTQNMDSKKAAGIDSLIRLKNTCAHDGALYLETLKKYLEANKTTYTVYASDPLYTEPSSSSVANSDSNNYFYGG